MDNQVRCRGCGVSRPSDAPRGLCPACLLKAGLGGDISVSHEFSVLLGPITTGVLASIAESMGGIPHVLLHDTNSDLGPGSVVKPGSSEMPDPSDRSARLQLFGEIARGGMGAVLKGRDADLGRDLAVKVLLDVHRDRPELVRRFVEEAQITGQLQHPGIVPVYELGAFADRRPYLAMKLVKGRTLAALLADRKHPADDLPRLLGIFEQVAQTVAYAHARGVIHRDLKPSNIMVGSFGEVQVMDWGLAKVLPRGGAFDDASAGKVEAPETIIATARAASDSDLSQAGSVLGTPSYMAPEQARGEIDKVDERVDVFALGSILCELLTGQPAFTGRSAGEIQRKAARGDLDEACRRLQTCQADPELLSLTRSCLSTEQDDRPRHADEVAQAISAYRTGVQERLRTSELERARAEAKAAEEFKRRRLTVALAASIVALLTLGGGGAAWVAQQRQVRITEVERTLARIETMRDQAVIEGADSTRRREVLAAADQALASIGDLVASEPGRRLSVLRAKIADDEVQAKLDQTFITELVQQRTHLARKAEGGYDCDKIDSDFAGVFRRYKMDLDTTPTNEAITRVKAHPAAFVQEVLGAVDQWLMFRYEIKVEDGKQHGSDRLPKLLQLARELDPEPQRNALRALLEQTDLTAHLPKLTALAAEAKIFDLGASTPMLLARSLVSASDPKTAITVLRKSVVRYPGDLWTNLELAELLRQSPATQGDEAIRFYTAVRALRPEAGWMLIPALLNQNRVEEAEHLLDAIARLDPLNLTLFSILADSGVGMVDRKRIGSWMIAGLQASLVNDPKNVAMHWKIAAVATLYGHSSLAIAHYRETARLDPLNGGCRYELGVVLRRSGDLKGAITAFREAIRLAPTESSYHEELADLLGITGDHSAEVTELRQAIRCDKLSQTQRDATPVKRSYGLFENDGCLRDVLAVVFEGFTSSFDDLVPSGHYTKLGSALAEGGDMAGALTVCEEGIPLGDEREKSRLTATLGNVQHATVNLPGAIAAYRKSIQLDPTQALETHYGLGIALAESSNLPEAVSELQEALGQDRIREFRVLRAVMMARQPHDAIAALRRVREQAHNNREIVLAIDEAIGQFENLSKSGVRVPKIVRVSDNANFARLCQRRGYFAASAAIWSTAFAPDRYNAACSAALAGCGQGNDPPPDEAARAKLRMQAVDWLAADLRDWSRLFETDKPKNHKTVQSTMQHWRKDADLAGVRDADPLAKLTEAERKEWQSLWADVDQLLKTAEQP
jgi:eukaryotic-like serine/threonine-protein kinase